VVARDVGGAYHATAKDRAVTAIEGLSVQSARQEREQEATGFFEQGGLAALKAEDVAVPEAVYGSGVVLRAEAGVAVDDREEVAVARTARTR
jgi:hypothetical protein